jgi:hypothetical protein
VAACEVRAFIPEFAGNDVGNAVVVYIEDPGGHKILRGKKAFGKA